MFSHVFIGVGDFERAYSFYAGVLPVLGLELRFREVARPWAGWHGRHGGRPLLLIGAPFDGQHHRHGNGQMIAFDAESRRMVDAFHAAALDHGGTSEGAPGLRPQYHAHYYGAYVRDPDGNKLCAVCHVPEPPS